MLGLLTLAFAGDPALLPVDRLACAWALHFEPAYPWAFQDPPTTLSDATALVVEAPADRLRPRDLGYHVLYVEGSPVDVLAVAGDRALVLVPTRLGTGPVRAWFGDERLPERFDPAARARVEAASRGLEGVGVPQWGDALRVEGRNDLLAQLADWETRCR